jgi:hypothetical protein
MKVTSTLRNVSFCAAPKYCCVDIRDKNEKIRITTNIDAAHLWIMLDLAGSFNALQSIFGAK